MGLWAGSALRPRPRRRLSEAQGVRELRRVPNGRPRRTHGHPHRHDARRGLLRHRCSRGPHGLVPGRRANQGRRHDPGRRARAGHHPHEVVRQRRHHAALAARQLQGAPEKHGQAADLARRLRRRVGPACVHGLRRRPGPARQRGVGERHRTGQVARRAPIPRPHDEQEETLPAARHRLRAEPLGRGPGGRQERRRLDGLHIQRIESVHNRGGGNARRRHAHRSRRRLRRRRLPRRRRRRRGVPRHARLRHQCGGTGRGNRNGRRRRGHSGRRRDRRESGRGLILPRPRGPRRRLREQVRRGGRALQRSPSAGLRTGELPARRRGLRRWWLPL